eukprot:1045020-Rhodomonas_salina.1
MGRFRNSWVLVISGILFCFPHADPMSLEVQWAGKTTPSAVTADVIRSLRSGVPLRLWGGSEMTPPFRPGMQDDEDETEELFGSDGTICDDISSDRSVRRHREDDSRSAQYRFDPPPSKSRAPPQPSTLKGGTSREGKTSARINRGGAGNREAQLESPESLRRVAKQVCYLPKRLTFETFADILASQTDARIERLEKVLCDRSQVWSSPPARPTCDARN